MNDNASCIYIPPISNEKIINYNVARLASFNEPHALLNPPIPDKLNYNQTSPVLLIDDDIEEKMANNWNNEMQNIITYEKLEYFIRRYPTRPWLYGISYNIGINSELLNLNYYNHRDYICKNDNLVLNRLSLDASIKIMQEYNQNFNVYPVISKKWFDNNTRSKTI